MPTIHLFKRSYDGRDTRIMYEALDLACSQLGTAGRPHSIRRIIAQRILKAMEKANAILQDFALSALPLWAR